MYVLARWYGLYCRLLLQVKGGSCPLWKKEGTHMSGSGFGCFGSFPGIAAQQRPTPWRLAPTYSTPSAPPDIASLSFPQVHLCMSYLRSPSPPYLVVAYLVQGCLTLSYLHRTWRPSLEFWLEWLKARGHIEKVGPLDSSGEDRPFHGA
ncbi:hypothetical protein I3843_03G221100 [Carya illinoinensis]|nr:hypothetical protein I3843_03G221100 [Carya illinoinensis]